MQCVRVVLSVAKKGERDGRLWWAAWLRFVCVRKVGVWIRCGWDEATQYKHRHGYCMLSYSLHFFLLACNPMCTSRGINTSGQAEVYSRIRYNFVRFSLRHVQA